LIVIYLFLFNYGTGMNKKIRTLSRNLGDPEDPFDENYLITTKRKYGESTLDNSNLENNSTPAAMNANGGDEKEDDLEVACDTSLANEKDMLTNARLMGIEQALQLCIDRCDNEEMKKRVNSCILVVGGGLSFPGARQWIERLCSVPVDKNQAAEVDQVPEVIIKAKDMDPKLVTWKGAAVMSLLDTANELWFDLNDWNRLGVRVLRERAPFIW